MAVSDDYQNTLEQLAQVTAEQVRTESDPVLIVALINQARARAVATADVFTARQLEVLTDEVVTSAGIVPTDDSERLSKALDTIESEQLDAEPRLERLARSEVFTAAQDAVSESLSRQRDRGRRYVGWVRQMEPDHCQLCEWWSRDGRVFPKSHRMPTHPNCNCVQRVVITDTRPKPMGRNRGRRNRD